MFVDIKRVHPDAILPKYGSDGAAGADLYALLPDGNSCQILPNESKMIGTGVALNMRFRGMAGFVFPRSGLGSRGLVLGNLTGVIDSDYQGEIKVCLWNRSEESFVVKNGDRIAQLVFMPVYPVKWHVVESFESNTFRGAGGFGSTGS